MDDKIKNKYKKEAVKLQKIVNKCFFSVTGVKNSLKKECYNSIHHEGLDVIYNNMTNSAICNIDIDITVIDLKKIKKIITQIKKNISHNKNDGCEIKLFGCSYSKFFKNPLCENDTIIPATLQFLIKEKHKYCVKSPFKKDFLFFDHEEVYENPRKSDLKDKKECIKFEKKYGFDPTEIWSLYHCIAVFVLPRLVKLKESKYKGLLCKNPDSLKIEDSYYTEKETECIYDKMIESFKWAALEHDSQDTGILLTKEKMQSIREGFELFGKHFLELSD